MKKSIKNSPFLINLYHESLIEKRNKIKFSLIEYYEIKIKQCKSIFCS